MLDPRRTLRFLASGSAIGVFSTMVLGGYVSASGAGLACPDWPLCKGEVIPDVGQAEIALEFTHRLLAATTGALIAAALVATLRWFREVRSLVALSGTSFMLLIAQVSLGMLTIASQLDPVVVTMHLALAAATFASVLLLAVFSASVRLLESTAEANIP